MEDVAVLLIVLIVPVFLVLFWLAVAIRILPEYQRGVVFRLGRFLGVRGPGLLLIIPFVDQIVKVDLRAMPLDIPRQRFVTRDRRKVNVSAVLHYQVIDPEMAITAVEDYRQAVLDAGQTGLAGVVGQRDLDELLAQRDAVNAQWQGALQAQAESWGLQIPRAELRDVDLI